MDKVNKFRKNKAFSCGVDAVHPSLNDPVWRPPHRCPHTDHKAIAMRPLKVRDARVIEVEDAHYRHATISGVFVLHESEPGVMDRRWLKVRVWCSWFGHRPQTGPITIQVDSRLAKFHQHYTGLVFTNITR
ncbi:MAG: hypothetical protein KGL68_06115 [Burkholderiales bacterium]|nr:hypothetical protein [Burkholderiales bacterium]